MFELNHKLTYLLIGLFLKWILPIIVYFSMLNSIFEFYQIYVYHELNDPILVYFIYFATFIPVFFLVRFVFQKIMQYWYIISCKIVEDLEEFTRLALLFRLIKKNTPRPKVSRIGNLNIRDQVMSLLGDEGAESKIPTNPIMPIGDETVIYYSQKSQKKIIIMRILYGLIQSLVVGIGLVVMLAVFFGTTTGPDDFKSTWARIFGISLLTGLSIRALWPTITAIRYCFNRKLMILSREKIVIYGLESTLHSSFMKSKVYNVIFDPEWHYIKNFELHGTLLSFDCLNSVDSRNIQKVSFDIKHCELTTDELWGYLKFYYNEYKKNPDKYPRKIRYTFSFFGK